MNRGSMRHMRHSLSQVIGFNEAPIHESGKSYVASDHGKSVYSFNEAPIHESGKWHLEGRSVRRYGRLQ